MFLTKMLIRPEDIYKHRTDYETHRTVCSILPTQGHHLFVKKSDHVLILSEERPEGDAYLQTKEISPEQFIQDGSRFRFRILVNPTVQKAGKRVPLVGAAQTLGWLKSKSSIWGITLEDAVFIKTDRKVSHRQGHTVTIYGTALAGILQVSNKEAFSKVFKEGVGRARRLGYGMFELTLA